MLLALSPALGQAGIISYNWDLYGTVPTNSTSFAGVVSAANWNDSYTISPTANPLSGSPWSNLIDDSGVATTMDISFNSVGQWQLNPLNVAPSQDLDGTYNKRMLKGYVDMSGGQPVTVTLAEIPYAKYDIYIYMNSAAADREGYVTDGASKFYFRTYGSGAISGDNAVFVRATETTDLTPNAAANYAKFFNLSGASQTLTVFAAGNGGIAGIQVVEVTSPETNGIWTGGASNSNWSETANWSGGTVAQGADRSATFNGTSPATATIDSDFPIGSLLFSGADHTIAAGAGTLYLQGAHPPISVETGRTATIASSLLGSNGMQKADPGTLILSGSNGVTGTTGRARRHAHLSKRLRLRIPRHRHRFDARNASGIRRTEQCRHHLHRRRHAAQNRPRKAHLAGKYRQLRTGSRRTHRCAGRNHGRRLRCQRGVVGKFLRSQRREWSHFHNRRGQCPCQQNHRLWHHRHRL